MVNSLHEDERRAGAARVAIDGDGLMATGHPALAVTCRASSRTAFTGGLMADGPPALAVGWSGTAAIGPNEDGRRADAPGGAVDRSTYSFSGSAQAEIT